MLIGNGRCRNIDVGGPVKRYRGKRYRNSRQGSAASAPGHRHRRTSRRRGYYLLAAAVAIIAIVGVLAVAITGSPAGDEPVIADKGSVSSEGTSTEGISNGNATTVETSPSKDEPQRLVTLSMPATTPNPARIVKLPVLMFHHTGEPPAGADELRRNLTVSTADLEAQV